MRIRQLGFPWETADPFLFCVHHDDHYPEGDDHLGPRASLAGRNLGQDFAGKDGWRMYHGLTVPGFPQHPHRGFETVTIVRRGFIDHSDSLGASARFGGGDVQWLTAGRGIVHSEMFPLLQRERDNPLELFQIWLNLPRADKLVEPHFSMLWNRDVPRVEKDGAQLTLVAGSLGEVRPPSPPPHSWAARPESQVVIWTVRLLPGARLTLPAGKNRQLYSFRGGPVSVDGNPLPVQHAAALDDGEHTLENGDSESELLVLGGQPIGEPIAQYGPFVMNSPEEIQQAFVDYRRTAFGGWPWPKDDPVHARSEGRFARHADGRVERGD